MIAVVVCATTPAQSEAVTLITPQIEKVHGQLDNSPDSKVHGPTWGPSGSCRPQPGPMLPPWASCQICKIAGCACAGNAGSVFLWQFCISIDLKKIATTCHSLWGQLMTWYVEFYTVYHTLRWMITCILSFIGIWGHWNINEINKIIPISVCLLNNNVVGYVYDRL